MMRWVLLMGMILGILGGCGSTPPFPLDITMRSAAVGEGYVLHITNPTQRAYRVTLTALNKSETFVLDGGATKEFGWLEGFKFAEHDTCTLTIAGTDISKTWQFQRTD